MSSCPVCQKNDRAMWKTKTNRHISYAKTILTYIRFFKQDADGYLKQNNQAAVFLYVIYNMMSLYPHENRGKDKSIRNQPYHSGWCIFYFLQCLLCCLVHLLAFLNLFYQSDTFCIPCRNVYSLVKHEHLHF